MSTDNPIYARHYVGSGDTVGSGANRTLLQIESQDVHSGPEVWSCTKKVFSPKCEQVLEGEGISVPVFEKKLLNVLVPSHPQLTHLHPTSSSHHLAFGSVSGSQQM